MDGDTGSKSSTVAERIQALQDLWNVENRNHKTHQRALTRSQDSGVTSGLGRREEASFASPAGRASRDGNEGVRGDGRPPVGILAHKLNIPIEESIHFSSLERVKPADRSVQPGPSSHIKMEGSNSELAQMRAKLRSVQPSKTLETTSRNRAYTLAELGHILDKAIDESTARRQKDKYYETGHTKDRMSSVQSSNETRSESSRIGSESGPIGANAKETRSNEDAITRSSQNYALLTSVSNQSEKHTSPVKQRTAMFESMRSQMVDVHPACEAPHTTKQRPDTLGRGQQSATRTRRVLYSSKDRSESPLIPLALPQLINSRQAPPISSSDDATDTFVTPKQSFEENSYTSEVDVAEQEIKMPSPQWPMKWNILNKTNVLLPLQSTCNDNMIATKDEHYPNTLSSIVKGKVRDLLEVAKKRDENANGEEEEGREHLSWRQSRPADGNKVTGLREQGLNPSLVQVVPSSQAPVQQQTKLLSKSEKEKQDRAIYQQRRVSINASEFEKEALDRHDLQSTNKLLKTEDLIKSTPSTPRRGRSINPRPSTPHTGADYSFQHRFALSPARSRSGSRASKGTIKLELEIRDSPGREAHRGGDKIVTIRANVEEVDSTEETRN